MSELKPCPFCGKDAEITPAAECGPNAYMVACSSCFACSVVCVAVKDDVRPMLIDAWNARPIEDALRVKNARLRGALKNLLGFGTSGTFMESSMAIDDARAELDTPLTQERRTWATEQ